MDETLEYRFFKIKGDTGERIEMRSDPKSRGIVTFTPNEGLRPYCVILTDQDGFEVLVDIFDTKDEAIRVADFTWNDWGVAYRVDMTTDAPVKKFYTVEDIPTMQ